MVCYLDCNATTPLEPRVLHEMEPYLKGRFGNPASSHATGRAARSAVERAAHRLATLLGVRTSSIVWTSGATEALNLILKGLATTAPAGRSTIISSSVEHKAVLDTLGWLHDTGQIEVRLAPVTQSGEIDYTELESLVDEHTLAVCVMAANNETGVLNDVQRAAQIAHKSGAALVCDATQQAGKVELDLTALGPDFSAVSAHKMYGPQGIGAMVANQTQAMRQLVPLIHGGGHQSGLRSGTLNVPGIVGFGAAAELVSSDLPHERRRLASLRRHLEQALLERAAPLTIHGVNAQRLPNTTNVRLHGVEADALIANCSDVAMSPGSACSSAVPAPSHVLMAMGLAGDQAEESIRLSLGRFTTEADVEKAAELIGAAAARIRQMNA